MTSNAEPEEIVINSDDEQVAADDDVQVVRTVSRQEVIRTMQRHYREFFATSRQDVLNQWEHSILAKMAEGGERYRFSVEKTEDPYAFPLPSFNYITRSRRRCSRLDRPLPLTKPRGCDRFDDAGCCVGDCARFPAFATDEIAYDAHGRLRDGFSLTGQIIECSEECACAKRGPEWKRRCRNREAQRAPDFALELFHTKNGRGWGVRTFSRIERGEFIFKYYGEILPQAEAEDPTRSNTYQYELARYTTERDGFVLDSNKFGNLSRFLNHSCEPNVRCAKVYAQNVHRKMNEIAFFAKCEIEPRDGQPVELTLDYFVGEDENGPPMGNLECLCGAPRCRKEKRFFRDRHDRRPPLVTID